VIIENISVGVPEATAGARSAPRRPQVGGADSDTVPPAFTDAAWIGLEG
jgi:hypothetical protein